MDCDLVGRWFRLRRGVVKTHETQLKTEASRRGIPMRHASSKITMDVYTHGDEEAIFALTATAG
jgi:hypothetical protein